MSSTGFGEQIHPTDRIREVLNAYSFSSAILREILANSDDAGATEQVCPLPPSMRPNLNAPARKLPWIVEPTHRKGYSIQRLVIPKDPPSWLTTTAFLRKKTGTLSSSSVTLQRQRALRKFVNYGTMLSASSPTTGRSGSLDWASVPATM